MAKSHKPSLKVIFITSRPMKSYTDNIGTFVEMPVLIPIWSELCEKNFRNGIVTVAGSGGWSGDGRE